MMKNKYKQFGNQLKIWRQLSELNDSEIAALADVSRVSVSKWMNGHSLPNALSFIILIDAIAKRTGVEQWTIMKSLKTDINQ